MVPESAKTAIAKWLERGSPPQVGIAWPRQRWIERFPGSRELFSGLPDQLDRRIVREHCASAGSSPEEAERAFLIVMTWGYGDVGYGPFRVARILGDTRDASGRLQRAVQSLASGGPLDGYDALGDYGQSRLKWLGPAFGTKFLHFCSPPRLPPALILDRLVADWLRINAELSLNPVPWSTQTYRRYIDLLTEWARELAIEPDELETCLFTEEAGRAGSQWGSRGTGR